MHRLLLALLLASSAACAQDVVHTPSEQASQNTGTADKQTIRICDEYGCAERPRNYSSFNPAAGSNPQAEQRLQALREVAERDPRAAYDLGLRHFRGDGVRQDSYQAIRWMREAGEAGVVKAQLALGQFYLMGLEEMGSDPAEAEKWLGMAADAGDKSAVKLLQQARTAKRNEAEYRRWVNLNRSYWYGYWHSGYAYGWHWGNSGWYYR